MKRSLFFLTCIIGLLSLIGCSKDEIYSSDSNSTKSTKIRWYGVKTVDTKSTTRGVSDEGNLWNQRVGIYVKFLNVPKDTTKLEQVKQIAAEWEEYAGIKFNFVNGEAKANVRIAFDWQGNDWLTWSYTGTDAKLVTDQTQPTAVLAGADDVNNNTFKGDVLRLFGQILGLEYEQRHQDWNAWKNEAQLQSYWEDQFDGMNMDWEQIREYVFTPLINQNSVHTVQTDELDELSIMAWPYYTKRQTNKIIANFELSESDKTFIADLYPKSKQTLPTIQEAWINTGFFEWTTKENSGLFWRKNAVVLKLTDLGAEQEYLPDVSDGEQLNSAKMMFSSYSPIDENNYTLSSIRLQKIPQFNTSNITDFSSMFQSNNFIAEIPFMDTSKGTDFSNMFSGCRFIKSIPMIDTRNGTDFSHMFHYCYNLAEVPFLDTSKATDLSYMFSECRSITTIPPFNTSNNTDFRELFSGCRSLTSIPDIDTSKGINFSYMFSGCKTLTSIPDIDTSKGINFSYMFSGCKTLPLIPLIDTSNAIVLDGIFQYCNVSSTPPINTSNATSFTDMFFGCSYLTSIPDMDTSKGTNFSYMFYGCSILTHIPTIDTSNGAYFFSMFSECSSLQEKPQLDLSNAKSESTKYMYSGTPFENSL